MGYWQKGEHNWKHLMQDCNDWLFSQAATQTTYFQTFQQGYASGGHNNAIFNNRSDLKLVLEVADIIDELKVRALTEMHVILRLTRDDTF